MRGKVLLRFALAAGCGLAAIAIITLALAGVLSLADRVDAGDALATVEAIALAVAAVAVICAALCALERAAARLERGGRW